MKPFAQEDGLINEFFLREAILELFPKINIDCLNIFLDSLQEKVPGHKLNGFMAHYSLKEVLERFHGKAPSKAEQQRSRVEVTPAVIDIYQRDPLFPMFQKPPVNTNINGTFVYGHIFQPAAPPSDLKQTVRKLKEALQAILQSTLLQNPAAREKNLPLTVPILKLALIEDAQDSGIINEDIFVRILQEAFPSFSPEELFQLAALGRVGKAADRKLDYEKMLKYIEELFLSTK